MALSRCIQIPRGGGGGVAEPLPSHPFVRGCQCGPLLERCWCAPMDHTVARACGRHRHGACVFLGGGYVHWCLGLESGTLSHKEHSHAV